MYLGIAPDHDEIKRSTKGIPKDIQVDFDSMLECLKGRTIENNTFQLRLLRKQSNHLVCRASTTKRFLSDVFFKMRVGDDKITCSPLEEDGKIL